MKRWVLGFLFDEKLENVVLISKKRPIWQRGLLNGVGGHIEEGETVGAAMAREFKEETGVWVRDWILFAKFEGLSGDYEDCVCYFLFGAGDYAFKMAGTVTDESIVKVPIKNLPKGLVKNLYWLIPLCFDYGVERPLRFGGIYPKGRIK